MPCSVTTHSPEHASSLNPVVLLSLDGFQVVSHLQVFLTVLLCVPSEALALMNFFYVRQDTARLETFLRIILGFLISSGSLYASIYENDYSDIIGPVYLCARIVYLLFIRTWVHLGNLSDQNAHHLCAMRIDDDFTRHLVLCPIQLLRVTLVFVKVHIRTS